MTVEPVSAVGADPVEELHDPPTHPLSQRTDQSVLAGALETGTAADTMVAGTTAAGTTAAADMTTVGAPAAGDTMVAGTTAVGTTAAVGAPAAAGAGWVARCAAAGATGGRSITGRAVGRRVPGVRRNGGLGNANVRFMLSSLP